MTLLDMPGGVAHGASGIVEGHLLLPPRHQSEELARLLPIIIVDAMVPMGGFALFRLPIRGPLRFLVV
jgi:hypothetical protein